VKLASLFFFGLLYYAHQVAGIYEPLMQPLCGFREGDLGQLGFALIGAIMLVGVLYLIGLKQASCPAEAANIIGAGVLLLIVAATPSHWPLHTSSAVILLAFVFAYFASLLYRSGSHLLYAHLAFPLLLAIATKFQYGIWQKSLICYFIAAIVVHHHLISRSSQSPLAATTGPPLTAVRPHARVVAARRT